MEDDIIIVQRKKRKNGATIFIVAILICTGFLILARLIPAVPPVIIVPDRQAVLWDVQAVDTVKFSRDVSREKANDPLFDAVIDRHMRHIASLGATHVAIGTPYDDEFIPMMERWVWHARAHGLRVWFRGNFSGWEGWFEYPRITRAEHRAKTISFVKASMDLFEDGDIFTSCTECENGGPGDPRKTGDVAGFRMFLIDEYRATQELFGNAGKAVASNYFPMNGDVARLVMNKDTTRALGGLVVVDHYVFSAARLARDIEILGEQSGGEVMLGEFGAPIPDIHGAMTEKEQAAWVHSALQGLASIKQLRGVNYWVAEGGSTALWSERGEERDVVATLRSYFKPRSISGVVVDEFSDPISYAIIEGEIKDTATDAQGFFVYPVVGGENIVVRISAPGYLTREVFFSNNATTSVITLIQEEKNLGFYFRQVLRGFRRAQ